MRSKENKRRRNQAICPRLTRGIVRCRCYKDEQRKLQNEVRQGPAEQDVQYRGYHDQSEIISNKGSNSVRRRHIHESSYNRIVVRNHKKSSDMLLEEGESAAKRDEAG